MKLLVVEANISAGKSTMVPKLAKEIGFTPLLEPADDKEFSRLLKAFTDNPNDTQVRLDFQLYITRTRAEMLNGIPDGNYIIERSLFSDLIFSQCNLLGTECPTGDYISYYYEIKRRLTEYPKVDAVIYLQTTPELVYDRMINRGRDSEKGTPLHYIQDLHRFHEAGLPQICREYNTELITRNWDDFGGPLGIERLAQELRVRGIV